MSNRRTVDGSFRASARCHPERVFLRRILPDGTLVETTYAEAAVRIACTVRRLRELGATGQMVACYVDDLTDSLFFWLSCFHVGAVPVPTAPSFSVRMIRGLADRTRARVYFSRAEDAPKLFAEGIRPLAYVDAKTSDPAIDPLVTDPSLTFEQAMTELEAAAASHDGDSPLLIIPTSGTTGESKLPMWSHKTMERSADDFLYALGLTGDEPEQERFLLVNSLNHGLGMTNAFTAVRIAAAICIPSKADVHTPLEDVRRLDFSSCFMTPRVARSLRKQWQESGKSETEKLLGPRAKIIAFAGAPPDPEIMAMLRGQGVDAIDIWGSAEGAIKGSSPRWGWREGELGKPFPGTAIRVAEDGELLVKSDHQMIGYYGDPELTRSVYTEDGFYKTGDAGEITPEGVVRITGRKKDVFNTPEGTNIYPNRIESLIEGFRWVKQVVLIGDRLPYIVGLVVVSDDVAHDSADGFLDPQRHEDLYLRARADLEAVNAKLESIEQVRKFALFARPFPETTYQVVTVGKIRRNRRELAGAYAACLDWLYAEDTPVSARTGAGGNN